MRFKIVSLIAAASFLAACSTQPTEETATTTGDGASSAASAASAGIKETGVVAGSQMDLVVNIGDRVHFAYDKYNLTSEAQSVLKAQAGWLAIHPSTNIRIEGHCDERGTREYNLALGERRASAAADYLVTLGVASSRVTTISYGKERPQNPGSNEAAWALNRRAVSVVK